MRRMVWLSVVLLALVATACGGGSGGDADLVVGEDDRTLPEPEPGVTDHDTGVVDAAAQLAAAFESAGDVATYRIDAAQGSTLRVPGAGLNQVVTLDEDRIATSTTVDGSSSYIDMNLTAMFGPLGTADDITIQLWSTPDLVVLDTTSYAQLLELNPSADVGPFAPGVSSIDLEALAGDSDDLVTAIAGSGPIGITDLTAGLIDILEDVSLADDARTFSGTATYGAVLEAQGADIEATARSVAGGLALNLGVDVDALTELYVDLYREAPADLVIVLDDAGLLAEIRIVGDLSALYEDLPALLTALPDAGISEAEAATIFANPVFVLEQLLRFDLDPPASPPIPDTTEDRTDLWVEFLEASGF
ncbi:MAG: hypothetical protein AAF081_12000 [Actinomycetota bacterium]